MSASRDGNGTFNRAYDWTDDAANSIPITASRFDTEMDGVASELTNSVAADGQTTMTGNLKMGGFKVTGMANGAASTDAVTLSQVQALIAANNDTLIPVGSYYINETNSTNPGTLLGFGTWTAVTDTFLVGHGSTYTATGGSATDSITVAVANLPATLTLSDTGCGDVNNGVSGATFLTGANSGANARNITVSTGGSGTAISVDTIPPYQAAYIWKRTA